MIETNRHYEAAKTIILTEHQRSICLLVMNERKFKPARRSCRSWCWRPRATPPRTNARDVELNAQAIERMKAKGAQIVIPERARFAARIAPIQDEVAQNLKMTDVLELIRSHAK